MVISQKLGQIYSQNLDFQKVIQFSWKQHFFKLPFSMGSTKRVHSRGLCPLKIPSPFCKWLAGIKEFMVSQEKNCIWYFLSIFFRNELKLSTNCNFSPLEKKTNKQCLHLTHSVWWYFEKLILKKPKNLVLNGHISKTRTNLESKLRLS